MVYACAPRNSGRGNSGVIPAPELARKPGNSSEWIYGNDLKWLFPSDHLLFNIEDVGGTLLLCHFDGAFVALGTAWTGSKQIED